MLMRRCWIALLFLSGSGLPAIAAEIPRATSALLSHHGSAAQAGNGSSDSGLGISDDGRFLLYRSLSSDLDPTAVDDNGVADVYLYDRRLGRNILISRRHDQPSRSASGASGPVALSADGRFVLFHSEASNILSVTDANGGAPVSGRDLFLLDRSNGETRLLTRATAAPTPTTSNLGVINTATMSRDGAFVAFMSGASDITPGISNAMARNQVYVYARADDSIRMLTTRGNNPAIASNGLNPFVFRISDDGAWVLFIDDADDLVSGASLPTGWINLYLFSGDGATRLLLSRQGASPNAGCAAHVRRADMNQDASQVVFASECATHIVGVTDGNAGGDLFRFDRIGNALSLLSHAHGNPLQAGNGGSEFPRLTPSGDVVFRSSASDLVPAGIDGNGKLDVYVRTAAGAVELVSVSAAGAAAGNGDSLVGLDPASDDGRFVIWSSDASDLDAAVIDDNMARDVFIRDRLLGRTELVSVQAGLPLRSGDGLSALGGAMTPDGTAFIYGSFATQISAAHTDGNGVADAFVGYYGALFSDGFE